MKKLLPILVFVLFSHSNSKAQFVDIPDNNFRSFLYGNYTSCFNTSFQMDTTCSVILNLSTLEVDGIVIKNFEGLQYFKNLQILKMRYCFPDTIPMLPITLREFYCSNDSLTTLPQLPPSLIILNCSANELTALPLLPPSLTSLSCSDNQLTALPVLPPSLTSLSCSNNQLTALPVLPPSLASLYCNNNQLSSLPGLPDSLTYLNCRINNIYCLPKLPGLMLNVLIDGKIKCLPNKPPSAIIFGATPRPLPICNPCNNSNQCTSFPVIKGTVFYDNNNNGIKDFGEPNKRNIRVNLSGGDYTFTNQFGAFEIVADSIGPYTVSVAPPDYYNAVPGFVNYNFTRYNTVVTTDFALQANTIVDSISIKLTALNWVARPGFSFPYLISYENTGTSTLMPNLVFNYDNTKLMYDSSSNASVVNNGSNLSLNIGSFTPAQQGSFIAYFRVMPSATLGDTINAVAAITANALYISDSSSTGIRGSFDPNDKQATPQLSPLQVANGEYIDYTIRFQNTGTDTAFSVVLSDTLNENLQAGTLEMLEASHTCKTTVQGNIIFFEFFDILLPDSNINEKASHGFVSFRIKPQTTVQPNTTIPNKAAIYFDYNTPVITNTAGTLIKNFIVVPLRLVSFSAVPQNDNTTTLYWATANEINAKQFVIEQSTDGNKFTAVRNIAAKEKAINDYFANVPDANSSFVYYRLKMVDKEGLFTFSPIIKIDRRKNSAGIAILTNPVKDFIVISTTNRALYNSQASIINTNGVVVKSFVIKQGGQTAEVKGLPTGVYYLRTANGSTRIIIQ